MKSKIKMKNLKNTDKGFNLLKIGFIALIIFALILSLIPFAAAELSVTPCSTNRMKMVMRLFITIAYNPLT